MARVGMEHGKIGPWFLAVEPEPFFGIRFASTFSCALSPSIYSCVFAPPLKRDDTSILKNCGVPLAGRAPQRLKL
jgi:hypothetical protein